MKQFNIPLLIALLLVICGSITGCGIIGKSSKYNFNDGIYQTKQFSKERVYVMSIDDDTISVFPVQEIGDSTYILTKQRINYVTTQRKIKDNKATRTFYRPSVDLGLMTIPLKYHFPVDGLPNTLTTNFNGAVNFGYRVDAYKLKYQRTPLNTYKQTVKHVGYSGGIFAGIGSAPVNATTLADPGFPYEYEGLVLITGIVFDVAIDNITVGVAFGTDHLLDKYKSDWIYQGQPNIGFTIGLNLNQ